MINATLEQFQEIITAIDQMETDHQGTIPPGIISPDPSGELAHPFVTWTEGFKAGVADTKMNIVFLLGKYINY